MYLTIFTKTSSEFGSSEREKEHFNEQLLEKRSSEEIHRTITIIIIIILLFYSYYYIIIIIMQQSQRTMHRRQPVTRNNLAASEVCGIMRNTRNIRTIANRVNTVVF